MQSKFRLVAMDMAILVLIPFLAVFIRFDGTWHTNYLESIKTYAIYNIVVHSVIFYFYGLYKRLWRYARVHDLFAILAAVSIGHIVMLLGGVYANFVLPKSIYIISWTFTIGMVGFTRLLFKITQLMHLGVDKEERRESKVIIVGAGDAGAVIAREIKSNDMSNRKLIGFIDDDINKKNQVLFGVKVLGTSERISAIAVEQEADEIIIAMPSVKGQQMKKIVNACKSTGIKVRIVPGIYELLDNKLTLGKVRDISLEDLLGREAIKLDMGEIAGYVNKKVVLITGAGGSIGSELSRQISLFEPQKIILLGRGENSIYEINQELKERYPQKTYVPVIADVRDKKRIEEIFKQHKPQLVFHAAAHKHVPLMEMQPAEAIKNNIMGTKNVAEAANQYGSERFVLISTDKAVNPTSVMGATKRIAEFILQDINEKSKTTFVTVRFGNVLGSRGSVVPLFKKQIQKGGPVTVTHPEMTRYFMTIPEAVQLVLQAASLAEGGEVFVLDMGEPVKIVDMAKDLISLHGLELGKDITIMFTGLRPGEKLYEELLTAEEGTKRTTHEKIFSAPMQPLERKELQEGLLILSATTDTITILKTLKRLIPSYQNEKVEDKQNEPQITKVS